MPIPDVVALQFELGSAAEFTPRYNTCPSNGVLIVRQDARRGRRWDRYRWGLVPGWRRSGIGNRLANARARRSRKACVQGRLQAVALPRSANGFYEWETTRRGNSRITSDRQATSFFGGRGITELWNDLRTCACHDRAERAAAWHP